MILFIGEFDFNIEALDKNPSKEEEPLKEVGISRTRGSTQSLLG